MKMNSTLSSVAAVMLAFSSLSSLQAGSSSRSLTIKPQSPSLVAPGGLGFFPISVTRAGGGSLSIYLSATGLPEGATVSFVPPEVAFTDQGPSTKNAVLVIRVPTTTPVGDYPITLSARHGNSSVILKATETLKVGPTQIIMQQPVLDVPVLQPDGTIGLSGKGTPSQPVLVQATTNLASATSWETIAVQMMDDRGLLSLVDQDSTNYPARFYRFAQ